MIHLVQFSTGAASAEVAVRAREMGDYALITANTTVEDADNWRFAIDVWRWLGEPEWHVITDGRHPMQVGRDRSCVPNSQWAVCSQELKMKATKDYLTARWSPDESRLAFGYDWTEEHRKGATAAGWAPWPVTFPLMERPLLHKAQILDAWRARGIEPPRLYQTGAKHANCGGCCVRGGQAAWRASLYRDRDLYLWWESEEEKSRRFLGKDVAIMRERSGDTEGDPLTLRAFRERLEVVPSLFDPEDWGACGCYPEDVASELSPRTKAAAREER